MKYLIVNLLIFVLTAFVCIFLINKEIILYTQVIALTNKQQMLSHTNHSNDAHEIENDQQQLDRLMDIFNQYDMYPDIHRKNQNVQLTFSQFNEKHWRQAWEQFSLSNPINAPLKLKQCRIERVESQSSNQLEAECTLSN